MKVKGWLRMSDWRLLPVVLVILCVGSAPAAAQVAFSVSKNGSGVLNLYDLNLESTALDVIGELGLGGSPHFRALDQSPDGDLYGVAPQGMVSNLYRLAPSTGLATLIGPLSLSDVSGLAFGPGGNLWVVNGVSLQQIDPSNAQTLNSSILDREVWVLAGTAGQLYGFSTATAGSLGVLNTVEEDGTTQWVADLGFNVGPSDADFDEFGNLWVLGYGGGPIMGTGFVGFYRVADLGLGVVEETFYTLFTIGDPNPLFFLGGLAMQPVTGTIAIDVPALDEAGLAVLVGLLAALGVGRSRRWGMRRQ